MQSEAEIRHESSLEKENFPPSTCGDLTVIFRRSIFPETFAQIYEELAVPGSRIFSAYSSPIDLLEMFFVKDLSQLNDF